MKNNPNLKFKVKRNNNLFDHFHGKYIIADPNGICHLHGFATKQEAAEVCARINAQMKVVAK